MARVELNGALMIDDASFHAECQKAFGFPETYQRTMDAWIDCLSYLRDHDGMSAFTLGEQEVLTVVVKDAAKMDPDLLEEMVYCIGGINERYEDYGELPALKLETK